MRWGLSSSQLSSDAVRNVLPFPRSSALICCILDESNHQLFFPSQTRVQPRCQESYGRDSKQEGTMHGQSSGRHKFCHGFLLVFIQSDWSPPADLPQHGAAMTATGKWLHHPGGIRSPGSYGSRERVQVPVGLFLNCFRISSLNHATSTSLCSKECGQNWG